MIVDVLFKREKYLASHAVISLCEERITKGYFSQGSLYSLIYVLQKKIGAGSTRANLTGLLTILHLTSINSESSIVAFQSKFNDMEDAMQHQAALSVNAECIITRNLKDYKNSVINVLTPEQFLK